MKVSDIDKNIKKDEGMPGVLSHFLMFVFGGLSLWVFQTCNKDGSRDKVLCKTTQYVAVVRGEELTYQPRETDTSIKQKWTCVSEWADNHSIKDSDRVYIKAEILKNIESGPK